MNFNATIMIETQTKLRESCTIGCSLTIWISVDSSRTAGTSTTTERSSTLPKADGFHRKDEGALVQGSSLQNSEQPGPKRRQRTANGAKPHSTSCLNRIPSSSWMQFALCLPCEVRPEVSVVISQGLKCPSHGQGTKTKGHATEKGK